MGIGDFIATYWSQLLTGALAIYAALLTTFTYMDRRRERIEREDSKKSKLRIDLSKAAVFNDDPNKAQPISCVNVKVTNIGEHKVKVMDFMLRLPKGPGCDIGHGYSLSMLNRECKMCFYIAPREFYGPFRIELERIREIAKGAGLNGTINFFCSCTDSLGKTYESEPFEIDL
jgi:hypothetical protein